MVKLSVNTQFLESDQFPPATPRRNWTQGASEPRSLVQIIELFV